MPRLLELLDVKTDWEWLLTPGAEDEAGLLTAIMYISPSEIEDGLTVGDIAEKDPENFGEDLAQEDDVSLDTPVYAATFDFAIDYLPVYVGDVEKVIAHIYFDTSIYTKGVDKATGKSMPALIGTTTADINLGKGLGPKAFSTMVQVTKAFVDFCESEGQPIAALLFTGKGGKRSSLYSMLSKKVASQHPEMHFHPLVLNSTNELGLALEELIPDSPESARALVAETKELARTSMPPDVDTNADIQIFALLSLT